MNLIVDTAVLWIAFWAVHITWTTLRVAHSLHEAAPTIF